MGRTGRSILLVLALVVAGATVGHLLGRSARAGETVLTGVIGSEKQRFFADPAVVAALRRHGLRLRVEPAGSRQMRTMNLAGYDFAFPGSAPAAAEIARQRPPAAAPVTVFSSPLAIATFTPIVDLLQTAKLTRRAAGGHWELDVAALVRANRAGLRWDQVPGNTTFPVAQAVLVATTRPADSNSAALFAAILNQVTGGDLAAVTKLFADQGAVDRTSEEPFESYLRRGKDFAPLVLVYEAQFADQGAGADRTLVYPAPTVMSGHTVVPFTAAGVTLARLLSTDPELQELAARHGFRTLDGLRPPGLPPLATIPVPDEAVLHTLLAALEERLT